MQNNISRTYRPDIDGIRAIAVLAVVLFHYGIPGFGGGFVGVDIFFVISGYLISKIIISEVLENKFTLASFYERRIRRIWPILLIVTLFVGITAYFLFDPEDLKKLYTSITTLQFFATNFYFWNQAGYFDAPSLQKPLLHTWSLAIEEQFYLIFPTAFVFLIKNTPKHIGTRIIFLITLASLFGNFIAAYLWPDFAFYWPITRAWELLLGVLITLTEGNFKNFINNKWGVDLLGIASIILILLSITLYQRNTIFPPGLATVIPCIATSLILLVGANDSSLIHKLLSQKILVGLGLISYSLYLWHWPIWVFISYITLDTLPLLIRFALIIGVIILSFVTWKYIEKPLRIKNKLVSRQKLFFAFLIISLSICVVTGFAKTQSWLMPARTVAFTSDSYYSPHPLDWNAAEDAKTIMSGNLVKVGDINKKPNFIVIGDSMVETLIAPFDQFAIQHHIAGAIASYVGCAPFIGVQRIDLPETQHYCKQVNAATMQYIEQHQIKNVIMFARWPLYTNGYSEKRFAAITTKPYLKLTATPTNQAEAEAVFAQAFLGSLKLLQQQKTNLWIILAPPENYLFPPNVARVINWRGGNPNDYGISAAAYQKRAAFSQNLFNKYRNTHVHVIDLSPYLFDKTKNKYQLVLGNKILYGDESHLSYNGVMLAKNEFAKIVQTIAKNP